MGPLKVSDTEIHICTLLPFAVSARESLVCLVNMTSLTENETFPINLYGPPAFQAMRSGTSQESDWTFSPFFPPFLVK